MIILEISSNFHLDNFNVTVDSLLYINNAVAKLTETLTKKLEISNVVRVTVRVRVREKL